MTVALDTVVKQLTDSGIVPLTKLGHFVPPVASPKNGEELASALVQENFLTSYQAQEICQGRANSLVVDNYIILDKIGAGGMGQVFRARHRQLKRVVALKLLSPLVAQTAGATLRFEREVEVAGKLIHPNIVTTYDAGEHDGGPYLAMEYIEGSDLATVVKRRGPLPVAVAVGCAIQATRGLEYAHDQGVVHRDVKPSNLLLDKSGTVRILDLGLARIEAAIGDAVTNDALTASGHIIGTVDYMSPEQATDGRIADHRSDVYSLGCTLYYLLTGRPMYCADTTMKRLLEHREAPIPDLRKSRPEVSDELAEVFRQLVAKNPAERYPSMRKTREALEAACPEASLSLGDTLDIDRSELALAYRRAAQGGARPPGRWRLALLLAGILFVALAARLAFDGWRGRANPAHVEPAIAVLKSDEPHGVTADRRAAGRVLSLGGKVGIVSARQTTEQIVNDVADLPTTEFKLTRIDLFKCLRLTEQDLRVLEGLEHLSVLRLEATPLQDAWLARVEILTSLTHLNISTSNISDRGLAHLHNLTKLTGLELGNLPRITNAAVPAIQHFADLDFLSLAATQIDDDGLAQLEGLTKLRRLSINQTRISDAGLASLENFPLLTDLDLRDSRISDRGLARLHGLHSLKSLRLHNVKVSQDAIEKLQAALPHCMIAR